MGMFAAKKEIGPDTVLQRRNDILFNEVDGEVVMLSIENGEYYGINKVGSKIWNLIESPISIEFLISSLLKEFSISKGQCETEVLDFLYTLKEKNLIKLQ